MRFAAMVVSGLRKYDRVGDVINNLGWLYVDSMHKYHCLVLMRKILITQSPSNSVFRVSSPQP